MLASRLNDATTKHLGAFLGKILEVDSGNDGLRGSMSLRARVEVDVRKPLKPKIKIATKNGGQN